jgi:hypothetical protein
MLKETLGSKFEVCSIFSQMLLLHRLLRTWGSLVKALPSKMILLYWKGQETAWLWNTEASQLHYREDNKYKCGFCQPPEEA